MSFLLMVFFVLVCLFEGFYPAPLVLPSLGGSALLTWLTVAVVAWNAWRISWRVRRRLGRDPHDRERVLHRHERARFYHQIALLAAYVLCLTVFGWGWAVNHFWGTDEQGGPVGAELLILAPFLVAQLATWTFFYGAERASQEAARRLLREDGADVAAWLEAERESSATGGRASYVLFQFRQKLGLVFIPVLLLVFQKELYRGLPHSWREWPVVANAGGILALALVFVTMPWIVRLVLGLKPLPPGPLHDQLWATARRLKFRCSNILLWNTRSGMANAMVIGIVPWIRYVVFTDRLVEEFSPDEVEAVFGHEVGHVKHHHMLYYLGFLTASMGVLFLAAEQLKDALGPALTYVGNLLSLGGNQWGVVPAVACMLAYIFVVFGFLSRRCERQADVFGCRAVSCRLADCPGHADGAELPPGGRGLCPTGIRTFIRALEKVALVNGISRDKPGFLQSWQHSTIARRVEFLQRVLHDPREERRFQRRVAAVKWAMFLVLSAALGLLVWSRLPVSAAQPSAHQAPPGQASTS
ncbi:MAG TPA: M48 family metallopeptidase [Gemmataceae bacterium]|jgi:Zn-dependent protease with chaperone function|nr:M48 family metallopeptidase [Gemmataceae bacterium]